MKRKCKHVHDDIDPIHETKFAYQRSKMRLVELPVPRLYCLLCGEWVVKVITRDRIRFTTATC